MAAGTEGYERNVPLFVEVCQGLEFHIVCRDFIRFLPSAKANVLDVGSGAGQNAAALDDLGFNVTAIEPMPEFLDAALNAYSTASVDWLVGSLPHLNCLKEGTEKFDFVLIESVWHHLNEIERAQTIAQLSKIMKRHGKCAISLRNGPAGLGSRVYATDLEVTVKQFENAGFKCIFKVQNQDSILPNKQGVKWSRLVLQKR